MLFVMLLLPLSTALVLFSLTTLPITVSWPRTLPDLAQLGRELHGYSQSGPAQMAHVIGVMAITAIWKHAWSIPGSVVWVRSTPASCVPVGLLIHPHQNVLAGALFSPAFATILLTSLTTIGSACATLLAMPLGPLITRFFPRALDLTRHALEGDSDVTAPQAVEGELSPAKPRSSAWVRLSVLRLIGVVPWSGSPILLLFRQCIQLHQRCQVSTLPAECVACPSGTACSVLSSARSPGLRSLVRLDHSSLTPFRSLTFFLLLLLSNR
jgi:hypothetical protein